jgi:drug/metabolite transporter (DMT)-like permease
VLAGLLAVVFILSNLALQFGASRLPAHVTAVVMLSEVLFASVSAVLWGDGRLTAPLLAGGALIVAAAVLAAAGARAPH